MQGYQYLADGMKLALSHGNRRYVFLPLIANLAIFIVSFNVGYDWLSTNIEALTNWLPSWLDWLSYVIKPLFVLAFVAIFFLSFSTLANLIAAPFYGFLSQHVCHQIRPDIKEPPGGLQAFLASVPRALLRELAKINYYLPRALGLWLLSFILPGINILLWFGFNAWMMTLQYLDYPIDNQAQPFKQVRISAASDKPFSFSFGFSVLIGSMVPLLNLLIMPAAVCGATKYWCEQHA